MITNGKNPGKTGILIVLACLILAGCQSLQKDLLVPAAGEKAYGSLAELEEIVIRLDGAGANRQELAQARQKVTSLEGTVADPDFEAQLAAWSGRLYLMEGKTSDAQKAYRTSQSLSPLNIPSQILSFRLEKDLPARLALIDQSLETEKSANGADPGELLAERGRLLFDLNRFPDSVAAFDAAFVLLSNKPYYEEAYRVFRDKAWELRNLGENAAKTTMEITRQSEITWKDLIEVTSSETDLLRFLTAGRNLTPDALFTQLLDRSFIPYTQDVNLTEWPYSKPSSGETVNRGGAAWFLWHLNAENRASRGLLTRYSSRFANSPNTRSPIPDLDTWSPFIDSVLGCVEWEFMSLPDGRNFMPREKVKGAEFLWMLKKLEP